MPTSSGGDRRRRQPGLGAAPGAPLATHPVHVSTVSTALFDGVGWALVLGAFSCSARSSSPVSVLIRPRDSVARSLASSGAGRRRARHDRVIGDSSAAPRASPSERSSSTVAGVALNEAARAGRDRHAPRRVRGARDRASTFVGPVRGLVLSGPIVGLAVGFVVAIGFRTWVSGSAPITGVGAVRRPVGRHPAAHRRQPAQRSRAAPGGRHRGRGDGVADARGVPPHRRRDAARQEPARRAPRDRRAHAQRGLRVGRPSDRHPPRGGRRPRRGARHRGRDHSQPELGSVVRWRR